MEKMICTCCGGTIDRRTLKCEYCGTQYVMKDDNPVIRVETFHNPVRHVAARTIIPREMASAMRPEDFKKYVLNRAIENIAESISDCVKFDTMYDPAMMEYVVHSHLKVVEPVSESTQFFPWGIEKR